SAAPPWLVQPGLGAVPRGTAAPPNLDRGASGGCPAGYLGWLVRPDTRTTASAWLHRGRRGPAGSDRGTSRTRLAASGSTRCRAGYLGGLVRPGRRTTASAWRRRSRPGPAGPDPAPSRTRLAASGSTR